jgi:Phage integrase family
VVQLGAFGPRRLHVRVVEALPALLALGILEADLEHRGELTRRERLADVVNALVFFPPHPHPHILIEEQVYEGERKRLKTEASQGRVPMSAAMARELQALRPADTAPEAPVFPSRAGTPLRYSNVYRRVLQPALRSCGLADQGVAFHAFRKACGSMLFASGKNLKQVQGWLRHSQLTTTLSVYIHELDDGPGDAELWDGIAEWGHPGATGGPRTTTDETLAEATKPPISGENASLPKHPQAGNLNHNPRVGGSNPSSGITRKPRTARKLIMSRGRCFDLGGVFRAGGSDYSE